MTYASPFYNLVPPPLSQDQLDMIGTPGPGGVVALPGTHKFKFLQEWCGEGISTYIGDDKMLRPPKTTCFKTYDKVDGREVGTVGHVEIIKDGYVYLVSSFSAKMPEMPVLVPYNALVTDPNQGQYMFTKDYTAKPLPPPPNVMMDARYRAPRDFKKGDVVEGVKVDGHILTVDDQLDITDAVKEMVYGGPGRNKKDNMPLILGIASAALIIGGVIKKNRLMIIGGGVGIMGAFVLKDPHKAEEWINKKLGY